MRMNNKVINISKKTFLNVIILFLSLIVISIIATYIIPKGTFYSYTNDNGELVYDYTKYSSISNASGINIFKGIFAPILVLGSTDGLSIIMLSLFLLIISASFQIMNDTNGIKVIVGKIINKFKNKSKFIIAIITLVFMFFGSFFGLFEEMLALLPIVVVLSVSLGYDSFTGFLISIVATGFGFASALTNPFTVIPASTIIGVSPMLNIWFRILVFFIMYGLLLCYIFHHIKVINKDMNKSPTFESDKDKKIELKVEEINNESSNKVFWTYITFLSIILFSIIVVTSIEALRGYTIVFLIVLFLIGGLISGFIVENNRKKVLKSFFEGFVSALPAIILILLASSIKYILEEGMVLATIANSISTMIEGKNIYLVAIFIYIIVLILEFFISSSTAKCILVMGILSCINVDLSKELLVLIYLFGDGYTNVLFPTSPVLLIGLSMIGMNYFTWIKKTKWLFLINFVLVLGLICLGIAIKY